MKTLRTPAAATLILLAAFAGNSGSATHASCAGSISGATTGSYTCTPVMAVWAKANNIGALTINTTGGPTLTIGIGFSGAPAVKTYSNADALAHSGVSVRSGTGIWMASVGTDRNQGSYSLKLSSVGAATVTPEVNSYPVHGTLTATLTPVAGSTATGNVTVSITF